MKKTIEQIAEETKKEVNDAIDQFFQDYMKKSGASENGVLPIDAIEELWDKLDKETRNNYVEAISKTINSINEAELIESKKENTN